MALEPTRHIRFAQGYRLSSSVLLRAWLSFGVERFVKESMQSTTVDELLSQGFTEDPEGLHQLKHSFALPLIVGTAGFVLSFAFMMFDKISIRTGLILAVAAWSFIVVTLVFMYKSRPRSRHTGRPMLKYKNRSPAPDVILEVIYVCPDSKTFSRRIYLENGDG